MQKLLLYIYRYNASHEYKFEKMNEWKNLKKKNNKKVSSFKKRESIKKKKSAMFGPAV